MCPSLTNISFLVHFADDYIEMLIQFGYVTLFASAYPLAAFLAMGANFIEIRSGEGNKLSMFCVPLFILFSRLERVI